MMAVQGASAAAVGGAATLVTMPLDTVKIRLQVVDVGAQPPPQMSPLSAASRR